jgi:hypothetical protein
LRDETAMELAYTNSFGVRMRFDGVSFLGVLCA